MFPHFLDKKTEQQQERGKENIYRLNFGNKTLVQNPIDLINTFHLAHFLKNQTETQKGKKKEKQA